MDTRHLQSFVAVAECGSVSEAARRLRIAQPALSRQIRALEVCVATDLLVRSAKGVTLTPAGARLFPYALSILRQIEAAPDVAAGPSRQVSGRVAVGLPTTASVVLSKPLLLAVKDELPNVRLHLVESLSGYLSDWVGTGRLDLSLLYDPEPSRNLHLQGILIEELALTGRSDAFPRDAREIPLAEIGKYPLALPGNPHSLRKLVERVSGRHGAALDVALEIDSLSVIKTAITECGYFSILAPAAIHAEVNAGSLRGLPIRAPTISRSVSLASSAVRGQTRACLEVGRLILRIAGELQERSVWEGSPFEKRVEALTVEPRR